MGKDREKRERDAYHEGRRDAEKGKYKSRGWVQIAGDQIFGKDSERKGYERGHRDGKKR